MRRFPLMVLVAVLTLASCGEDSFLNRREFVDDDDKASELLLRVDWDTYADGRPTGMSLYTYNEEGDGEQLVTNDVDSVTLRRHDGRYRLMLFNLSTDEFGSMNFHSMDDIDSAGVMLTTVTQRSNRSWDKGVVYQREPEQLYVALDTLVFPPKLMATRATDTVRYVVVERPRPLVSRLIIRVRIENIRGMRSVEGSIDGFSAGCRLADGVGTDSTGTHLLDTWKTTVDSVGAQNGYITTSITTFGLPPGSGRKAEDNVLKLAFTMADNTIRVYTIGVGDKFEVVPNDEFHSSLSYRMTLYGQLADVKLPEVKPSNNAGGFSAEVDNWDNGGDYDIVF